MSSLTCVYRNPLTWPSNNHIQDVLVVSYLANTIRTQIDLSNRLATAALTLGTGSGDALEQNGPANKESSNRNTGQRGGRMGRGGRNDG